jgi:hypothetical protein
MSIYLVVGNFCSLLSALCIAVSAVKQSKKDFMFWQIGDALFGILVNIALSAHSALIISLACLVRNVLSYQGRLTRKLTFVLLVVSVAIGIYANNLGIIGWLPIVASSAYTLCIYLTKDEQQMRYSLIVNMVLWFVHNAYVQAYPSALANIVLCVWTLVQIVKYRKAQRVLI